MTSRYATRGLLVFALLLATSLWLTRSHWENVDLRYSEYKQELHTDVLANRAPDPYAYKLWPIENAVAAVQEWTGASLEEIYLGNTLLSLLFLFLCHYAWLRCHVDSTGALFGSMLLAALCHVLFLTYWHHPYEFWGIGAFCLLLRAMAKNRSYGHLALGALITGVVWEKHALLGPIFALRAWVRRQPFFLSGVRGFAIMVAALALPIAVRIYLGDDRALIDGDTTLDKQKWGTVWWFQLPYMLPFVFMLLLGWRRVPEFVRWLWIYLPILVAAYLSQRFIIHEVRSFWALAPIFTATAVCVLCHTPAQDESALDVPVAQPHNGGSGAA